MNSLFLKHIVLTELKWKAKVLGYTTLVGFVGLFTFVFTGASIELFPIFSLLILFLMVFSTFASSIGTANPHVANQGGQSGFFSWKYIHSIVKDRKAFLLGYCIASVIASLPSVLIVFLALKATGHPTFHFIMSLPLGFIGLVFIRLTNIYQAIHLPRTTYFKYGEDLVARSVKKYREMFHLLVQRVSLLVALGFLIFLILKEGVNLAYIFGWVLSVLICIRYFQSVLRVWSDESLSFWSHKREYKKTLLYIICAVVSLSFAYHKHKTDFYNSDAVFTAIENKNYKKLKDLLQNKKILSEKEKNYFPIHYSILHGDLEALRIILDSGADINQRLTKGFRKYLKFQGGMTPLVFSAHRGEQAISHYLIEKGADIKVKANDGAGVLSYASAQCMMPLMESLVELGADINEQSKEGLTPLHYSGKYYGCLSSYLYLKRLNADESRVNKKGETFLKYIERSNPNFKVEIEFYSEKLRP